MTRTNVVENALGRLGGIATERLIKPRPVVSFSRAERMIEPWGVVPIEVYFVGNSQRGLPPEIPIPVVVRQTSGERRDQLGNTLPLESRELYFWPWQAFQEVSFYDLATDATFVLETAGADLGKYSTFTARVGMPAFSMPEFVSMGGNEGDNPGVAYGQAIIRAHRAISNGGWDSARRLGLYTPDRRAGF